MITGPLHRGLSDQGQPAASVVEQILGHGGDRVGLEAGSKPELMAVLALSEPGGMIVCNGYKDREYIRLALIGKRLGHRVYIVVEKLSELELVIAGSAGARHRAAARRACAAGLDRRRQVAEYRRRQIQVRPSCRAGADRWSNSCAPPASSTALQLLHFHLGSQIANVRDIQRGMHEVARYYVELRASRRCHLRDVDVGGGLGVDYEGTRSRSFCSMNYSVEEYANNVVHALAETCAEHGLPQPDIVTESGRAMTAHHAMLITNIIDIEPPPEARRGRTRQPRTTRRSSRISGTS